MDIIVTTPRSEMANAAREAADCIRAGGGQYFRRFSGTRAPRVGPGDRVYYVEDGFIRGFAVVSRAEWRGDGEACDTTGRQWPRGFYVYMPAESWQWISPIRLAGFQGFRYADYRYGGQATREWLVLDDKDYFITEIGGWLDPRPRSCRVCGCTEACGCPPPRGPCHWVAEDLCSACQTEGA